MAEVVMVFRDSSDPEKVEESLQLYADGKFTADMRSEMYGTDSGRWNYRRNDAGSYTVNEAGDEITFHFAQCQAMKCVCDNECKCRKPGMQPFRPPKATIKCVLRDGKLHGYPDVNGYYGSVWVTDGTSLYHISA